MTDVAASVNLPPNTWAVAQALENAFLAMIQAKKSGLTGAALITADVSAALVAAEPALSALGGVAGEVSSEPIGVAEAFSVAGFGVARALTGK